MTSGASTSTANGIGDRLVGTQRSLASIRREREALQTHPTFKDKAADYLRQEILSGRMQAGTRIDQMEIADTLGMSRVPVREALIELTQESLVESVPRRGSSVARIAEDDILDLFQLQGLVAGLVANRAVNRLSDSEIAEMRAVHEEFLQATDHRELSDLAFAFNQVVMQAGASGRLLSVLRLLSRSIPHDLWESTATWKSTTIAHQRDILDALERRDADAAASATQRLLGEGGRETVQLLRSRGLWS